MALQGGSLVALAAHIGWTTADKAAVATAATAAVAALASWASVLQVARLQRRALMPRLHIQVSEMVVRGGQNRIRARIENTGGGFAHEVWYWIREGGYVALSGLPPYGSLGHGQGSTIKTELQPVRDQRLAEAVVIWKYGTKVYAQSGAPAYRKSWSRRKWAFWAPKNNEEVVGRFFKDAALDPRRIVMSELDESDN